MTHKQLFAKYYSFLKIIIFLVSATGCASPYSNRHNDIVFQTAMDSLFNPEKACMCNGATFRFVLITEKDSDQFLPGESRELPKGVCCRGYLDGENFCVGDKYTLYFLNMHFQLIDG